jgi:hypothetical protein
VLLAGQPGLAHGSTPQDRGVGIQLLEAPTDRRDDPRAREYVVDHVSPGSVIERAFRVTNHTGRRESVWIYPGPAVIRDGQFIGLDRGATSELTTWTSVDRSEVSLDRGESTDLSLSIAVPRDASAGERYGVIWAAVSSRGRGQVTVVNRVGIRIYLSVGPGGEPTSDFKITSLTPGRTAAGLPVVSAAVTNTGGRALDMSGELNLSDGPASLSAGPFPAELGTTLAPGDRGQVTVELDDRLPDGPWRAVLTLRSGQLEHRATATLTFPPAGHTAAPVPVSSRSDLWWWWSLALVVALAGGVLIGTLLWRRRSRHAPIDPGGEEDLPPASASENPAHDTDGTGR